MKIINVLGHSFVPELAARAEIAIDCGANEGQFARWLSENTAATIFAFEPDPRLFARLPLLPRVQYVADAVAISVSRELGPLITAILVIGRSGSSFAAELGTMKVNEEIDALETMALDPVRFLVAPKMLAMLLMMPCLTIWADFMGFVGGSVFGVAAAGFTFTTYMRATLDALVMRDIITGLIKSVMFGLVITTVGCQEGLRTGLGAEEVGRSTTAAVVKSIFLVIMVDLVFTAMFYFGIG